MNHLNPAKPKAGRMTRQKRDLSMLAGKRGREYVLDNGVLRMSYTGKSCPLQLGVLFDCTEKSGTGIMTHSSQYRPYITSMSEWLFIKGIATQRQKKDKGVRPRMIYNFFVFYSLRYSTSRLNTPKEI